MSVATTYARALYEAASDGKAAGEASTLCDQLENQLDGIVKVIESSKELQIALYGPVTTAKEKVALIGEISKKLTPIPLMSNFISLLASKGRLPLLPQVREEFTSVRLRAEGGIPAKLVSADPIEASDVETLAKAFTKKLGKKVAFRVSTDPSLLAGIKVTVNGVTYDGTLRSQLQQFRDRLLVGASSS